ARTVPVLALSSVALGLVLVVVAPRAVGIRQDPVRPGVAGAGAVSAEASSAAHPSLQAHVDGLRSAWASLRRHPWGTGLGSNALGTLRLSGPLVREQQLLILAVQGRWLL